MAIPEVVRNNLAVSICSLLFGTFIGWVFTRLQSRTKRLHYSSLSERIGLSTNDPIFGTVQVTWAGQPVRNLYMIRITVKNESNYDFENVPLKVYSAPETLIYNERTSIVGTPYIAMYAATYKASLAVPGGQRPTPAQYNIYYNSREYDIPIFNRGQVVEMSYLCTRPNDDIQPLLFVSTQLKGVKLIRDERQVLASGVPLQAALLRGLLTCLLTVLFCTVYVHRVWLASTVCLIVGLFAQLIGTFEYKAERSIWKAFAG